jgi:A/G-specific adenine glycosylase
MSLWSGLGYYSRARNIHKTAKIILNEYKGKFPQDFKRLVELPGIGPSTAGAILSLAFELPGVILDGNVKRVIARFKGITNPIDINETQKEVKSFAEAFLPKKSFREYSQGVMDLGSLLCRPKNPICNSCPVNKNCQALSLGIQEKIPLKKPSKPKKEKKIDWLLISSKNKILLKRNDSKGIWKNLWLFPDKDILSKDNLSLLEKKESLPEIIHNLSHRKLNISTVKYQIKNKDRLKIDRSNSVWVSKADSVKMGMPKPIKEIIKNYL